jgi:4-diphosphocytidyl-2-C-methyl-D-erythritol kinase
MEILAPAKINLTLDITGRRTDGYHILQMVMQSISLYDKISIAETQAEKIEVLCDDPNVPRGEENTVLRAAAAFFARFDSSRRPGVAFHIHKQIPQQAGLGGGSTDAAAALKLLNAYYHAGVSVEQLREIGLSAGADVPFCIAGGTVLAEGIGERLKPVPDLPDCCIVICAPPAGICTKAAYAAFDAAECTSTGYTARMLSALDAHSLREIGKSLGNAFEQTDIPGDVREIKGHMTASGALGACMTGSGSAVFGIFGDPRRAALCRETLLKKYPKTFLCQPVSADRIQAISG